MEDDKVFDLLTKMYSDINTRFDKVENKIDAVQQEVSYVKQELTIVKDDLSGVKQELTSVKQDVNGVKQELTIVKEDVSNLKEDISKIGAKLDGEIIPKQQALFDGYVSNTEKLSEIQDSAENLRIDVNNISIKTLKTENNFIEFKRTYISKHGI